MTAASAVKASSGEIATIFRSRRQRKRFCRLVAAAKQHVPFYRELYTDLDHDALRADDRNLLSCIPVIDKGQLAETPLALRVDRRLDTAALEIESTTGSTGQPLAIYVNAAYKRRRNLRFLRGLLGAGYRPWQKLMLLTDRYSSSVHRVGTRYYVSVEQPTSEIAAAYARIEPEVLYGLTTSLRLLGEAKSTRSSHRPRKLISTGEVLDPALSDRLHQQFGAPVYDFYGMTETGLAAWRNAGADSYTMFDESTLIEFLRHPGTEGQYRVIVTNLDLKTTPIIRLDSGDLATIDRPNGILKVSSFDGRRVDTLIRADGSEVSPYRVTDAFRDVAGLRRFKVTQRSVQDCLIDVELDACGEGDVDGRLRSIIHSLVGPAVNVELRKHQQIPEAANQKFRPVESRVSR